MEYNTHSIKIRHDKVVTKNKIHEFGVAAKRNFT